MKKTILLAAFAFLFCFASCQKEESGVIDKKGELVFTATIYQGTKTTLNAQTGLIAWESGDEITVTDAAKTSAKYTVSSIDAQGTATFTKVAGQPSLGAGPYKAVYGTDPATEQTYSATAPSLPMSAESATTELTFTVSCGLLELTVTASSAEPVKNVRSIYVRGTPAGGTETIYKLNCPSPKSISSGSVFYIALPAGNYTKVYITNKAYLCDTTKTSSVDIVANTIEPKTIKNVRFSYAIDILCNVYPIVTIGTQTWMAENLKCDKYDTESEVYSEDPDGYFLNNKYVIPKSKPSTPTFKDTLRTPYYADATDKAHTWSRMPAARKQQTSLTPAQIAKLGYSYNWAAAVGVATDLLRTTDFTGKRQGICPNGWHVPSQAEVEALRTYIEVTDEKGANTAGLHLKSTSGWYDASNPSKYPQGMDSYGFNLLPAGFAAADSLSSIGAAGHIISATPSSDRLYKFYYSYSSYTNLKFVGSDGAPKCNGRSLRCIKND